MPKDQSGEPWYMNGWFHAILLIAGAMAVIVILWVAKSACEASAFTRMTGKPASTWDAMFLELRVQEPAKEHTP